ncbi:MAG: hypothetical protein WCL25_05875, partial [bacterium]
FLETPVFQYVQDKGAVYGCIHRINDLILLHPQTALDVQMFGSFLHFIAQPGNEDINAAFEMMANPTAQKGGMALTINDRQLILLEGLTTQSPAIKALLDKLTNKELSRTEGHHGVPYNRLYGYYNIAALVHAIQTEDMPLSIKAKKGIITPEIPTGDVTWFKGVRAIAMVRKVDLFIASGILPNEQRDGNNDAIRDENNQPKKAWSAEDGGTGSIIHDCKADIYIKDGLDVVWILDDSEGKLFGEKYYVEKNINEAIGQQQPRQEINAVLLAPLQADSATKTFARLLRMNSELLKQKIDYLVSLKEQGRLATRNGNIPLSLLRYSLATLKERVGLLEQYGLKLNTAAIRLKNSQLEKRFLTITSRLSLEAAYKGINGAAEEMVGKGKAPKPMQDKEIYAISCVIPSSEFPVEMREQLERIKAELAKDYPELEFMPAELLHTTVFIVFYDILPEQVEANTPRLTEIMAGQVREQIAAVIRAGQLRYRFTGISLGPDGGIFAQGYVEDEAIFGLRDYLGKLYPNPARRTPLCHISLARVVRSITPERFKGLDKTIRQYSALNLGEVAVSHLSIFECYDRFGMHRGIPVDIALPAISSTSAR